MSSYLLDTGIVIRHLRGQRRIVQLLRGFGALGRLSIATVTCLEAHAGMFPEEKYATQKLLSRFATYDMIGISRIAPGTACAKAACGGVC